MANASLERSPVQMECRKRSLDEEYVEAKRSRYNWYKLESESSRTSEEDTESVLSVQDKETDVVRDTSDTDTKSECSSDGTDVIEVEYDVASLSDDDNPFGDITSSGTDVDTLAAAGVIAAAICDSSLEPWITDAEDSDNSSLDETSFGRTDFWTCVQCKTQNKNPLFRYCEKCFQERKNFFPPRPKGRKKSKPTKKEKSQTPVKLDTLRSCLKGLSQDSGIGSSQEFPSLELDQIVVPKNLIPASDSASSSSSNATITSETDSSTNVSTLRPQTRQSSSRKRQHSESSLSDIDTKRAKKTDNLKSNGKIETTLSVNKSKQELNEKVESDVKKENSTALPEYKELCILCNNSPKNSIFLHAGIAHMCSCYKCAMRTWGTSKRCPVCNCKVKNVLKVIY